MSLQLQPEMQTSDSAAVIFNAPFMKLDLSCLIMYLVTF